MFLKIKIVLSSAPKTKSYKPAEALLVNLRVVNYSYLITAR